MTVKNHTEPTGVDALVEPLQTFLESAYEGLARISHSLDQALGADMTTALITLLGVFSLLLALFPFWSAWRRPSVKTREPAPAEKPVPLDATGEEIVQMHPECLQTLYGVAPTPPIPEVIPVQPEPEPASPAPERGQDVPLGLIADLSEELTQQHKLVLALQRQSEQQQLQIQSLTTQMKAQSSAFLLQGERLLRLESISDAVPEAPAQQQDAGDEDMQRLSTFDQAIELAGQGVTAEELISRCGLSVSEARLVVLVHGKQAAG